MIGQLVKRRRLEKGLTQPELALAAGLRQTYISDVEGGKIAMPRDHNLDALGKALDITRAEFYEAAGMFEGLEKRETPPPLPSALEEVMRQMQRDHPELVEQFDRRRADPDFAAQVRDLARVLNYSLRGYLGE